MTKNEAIKKAVNHYFDFINEAKPYVIIRNGFAIAYIMQDSGLDHDPEDQTMGDSWLTGLPSDGPWVKDPKSGDKIYKTWWDDGSLDHLDKE